MEEKNLMTVQQSQEVSVSIFESKDSFELGQRMARVFSESTLVPKQYQQNLGNCMIALNMANRMKSDPLMVMQNLAIVHNTPSFEAKFAIACFNATGKYSAIKYRETGERGKDSWGMIAYAIEKSTGEVCEGPEITIGMAKAEGWYAQNPKWKNVPDLMLRYRAASWFIRTTDPGVMMGFQTREEVEDYTDYVEVPADTAPAPQDANTETLNMPQNTQEAPADGGGDSQGGDNAPAPEGGDKPADAPQPEAPEAKPTAAKPLGKQETPDIFGGKK